MFPVGPALPHSSLDEWRSIWKKCRDVLAGEEAVKAAGEVYLPKMSRMSDAEYAAYKTRALFYGASDRTVQGLVGALLRKPPVVHAATDAIEEKVLSLLENITQTGTDFTGFTREVIREVLSVGRVGVLVDAPPVETALVTRLPYARVYSAEDIINWRISFYGGVPILDQVVVMEVIDIPSAGGFGTEQVIQYRELVLNQDGTYVQRIWTIDPPATDDDPPTPRLLEEIVPLRRGKPMNRLPFFFCSASHNRPEIESPPLLPLFNANLSHYRSSADLEHGRHFTALPTPVVKGVDTDDNGSPVSLEIGSSTAWLLPRDADAKMLEFNGKGLVHLENALKEKSALMTQLGARNLEQGARASETAEALRLRQAGDFATLGTISDCVGTLLTNVIRIMAWWSDITTQVNDELLYVAMSKDYFESRLTPAMLTSLVQAWQNGALGFRDLYEQLVRGEVIDPSRDYEDVLKDVQDETELRKSLSPQPTAVPGITPRSGQGVNKPTTSVD